MKNTEYKEYQDVLEMLTEAQKKVKIPVENTEDKFIKILVGRDR